MDLQKMADTLQALLDEVNAVLTNEAATAEEVAAVEGKMAQIEDLKKQIEQAKKNAETIEQATKSANEARELANKARVITNAIPKPSAAEETTSKKSRRILKVFSSEQDAYKAGMFLRSILSSNNEVKSNSRQWCESKGVEYKTLTSAVEGSAGLFVIPEIESAIIRTISQYGVARKNAKNVTMNSESRVFFKANTGNTAYFVTNQGQATVTDASWLPVTLTAKKLSAYAKYEELLSDDATINLAEEVVYELGVALAYREDYASFMGDGSSTNGGIVGITEQFKKLAVDAGGTWATDAHKVYAAGVTAATGSTWASVTLADLAKVVAGVKKGQGGKFGWYLNDDFHGTVMIPLALAAGGVYAAEVTNGVGQTFLGYPVNFVDVMPDRNATAANSIPVVFGDMENACVFGDRQGVQVKSENDFDTDTVKVKATERFDFIAHDLGNASSTAGSRVRGKMSCLAIKA